MLVCLYLFRIVVRPPGPAQSVASHLRMRASKDTGGFFVAIFEKREEFKPSARMRRDDRQMQMQAQKRRQEARQHTAVPVSKLPRPAVADDSAQPQHYQRGGLRPMLSRIGGGREG